MSAKRYLVTGGSGFIGSALVRDLVRDGHRVRVLDNESRGSASRLADVADDVEFIQGDVRDPSVSARAYQDIDSVCHLAFINGTEFFYTKPDLVLDVGVRGMINVLDQCMKHDVGELILASSSEVYQDAPVVPTDETTPLSVPDVHNPRFSYGGAKIICELMAINYGRKYFERVVIFRPHNAYGPQMGWEHVVPQFIVRMHALARVAPAGQVVRFPIRGDGSSTRSFVYVDDLVAGVRLVMQKAEHLSIYHIGTSEEMAIAEVASAVGQVFGREVQVVPGPRVPGESTRRCPDITKITALGYRPRLSFLQGLEPTAQWYKTHSHLAPHDVLELTKDSA